MENRSLGRGRVSVPVVGLGTWRRLRGRRCRGRHRELIGTAIAAGIRLIDTSPMYGACHFLRQAGQLPPADRARLVLGVAVEMPVRKGHDLLTAYRDGSARYLNYSGKAVIWEDHSDARIQAAITGWLTAGQVIADAIGVWDQPALPPLQAGHARLMMLTPGGHRFGQAPVAALSQTPRPARSSTAATSVLQLITSRA